MKLAKSCTTVFAIFLTATSFGTKLSDDQKAELYRDGRITLHNEDGSKRGHFEVAFAEGYEEINEDSKEAAQKAYQEMKDFVEADYWKKDVSETVSDGLELTEAAWTMGIAAIPKDYRKMKRDNKAAKGVFGAAAIRAKNVIKFGFEALGRTLFTPIAGALGVTYTVAAPVVKLAIKPVKAGLVLVFEGGVAPGFRHVGNTTMYLLAKGSDVPRPGEVQYMVRWVPAS